MIKTFIRKTIFASIASMLLITASNAAYVSLDYVKINYNYGNDALAKVNPTSDMGIRFKNAGFLGIPTSLNGKISFGYGFFVSLNSDEPTQLSEFGAPSLRNFGLHIATTYSHEIVNNLDLELTLGYDFNRTQGQSNDSITDGTLSDVVGNLATGMFYSFGVSYEFLPFLAIATDYKIKTARIEGQTENNNSFGVGLRLVF